MRWRCPICHQATDSAASPDFPFCGERCRLLDLGHWAAEKYRVSEPLRRETASERSADTSVHDEYSSDS
ncbi:MAG: DNA gyrase inhibitor YacG [Candidatus Acidiferrales bacterium]